MSVSTLTYTQRNPKGLQYAMAHHDTEEVIFSLKSGVK